MLAATVKENKDQQKKAEKNIHKKVKNKNKKHKKFSCCVIRRQYGVTP